MLFLTQAKKAPRVSTWARFTINDFPNGGLGMAGGQKLTPRMELQMIGAQRVADGKSIASGHAEALYRHQIADMLYAAHEHGGLILTLRQSFDLIRATPRRAIPVINSIRRANGLPALTSAQIDRIFSRLSHCWERSLGALAYDCRVRTCQKSPINVCSRCNQCACDLHRRETGCGPPPLRRLRLKPPAFRENSREL